MDRLTKGYHGFKRKHSRYVYVMENKDYIKIGVSFDPKERASRINLYVPADEDNFIVLHCVDCIDGESARTLEKNLHHKFRDFQIPTNIEGAKTECFSKSIKDDAIAALIEVENITPFDPFITCHPQNYRDFLELNNLDLLIIAEKLGKTFSESLRLKMKLSISCIIANLQVSDGKKIIFNNNNLSNLCSGMCICTPLLKALFGAEQSLTLGEFILPSGMSVRYDVRVGRRLKTKFFKTQVRPTYLLSLYSYRNNLSEYLTRMIETESTVYEHTKSLEKHRW
jgi:hypothetical protein